VEAISVASVDETTRTRMEGNDANALIASRMGIEPGDVTARLVTLHQKKELNGAADGRADDDDVVKDVNVSLTLGDLEDFERFEKMTAAEKLVPATPKLELKMRPAVLGATPIRPASVTGPVAVAAENLTQGTSDADTPVAKPAAAMEVVELASPPPPAPAPVKWCEEDDDEVEMEPEEDRAHGGREDETESATATEVAAMEPEEDRAHGGHETDVWPERRRYAETVEAEAMYMGIAVVEAPLLERDDLTLVNLQHAMVDVVAQVNIAHKALATVGHTTAERSREALQQSKIAGDLATEALLKAYEVSAVAALSSRQSWKMCVVMGGPHMPLRSKEAQRKVETTGCYLAYKLFGVTIKPEELAIAHFRGMTSNDFILKFTRTGAGSSHEELLHASKAMGRNRAHKVYAKIPQ
jgi:hypothetical protein